MGACEDQLVGRDFQNGKAMFQAGQCVLCHRFAGEGGRCGPDLGSVGKRFSVAAIASSICAPNEIIAEQYQASVVTMKDGEELHGRVIYRDEGELAVAYLYRIIESTEVESANLFAQVGGDLGVLNKTWRLTVGGGYAISPLSLAGDVDQIHGRVKFVYSPKTVDYYLSLFAPVDAPMGVLDGEMGWSLTLGVVGQL